MHAHIHPLPNGPQRASALQEAHHPPQQTQRINHKKGKKENATLAIDPECEMRVLLPVRIGLRTA
jgi:hypothetical protein